MEFLLRRELNLDLLQIVGTEKATHISYFPTWQPSGDFIIVIVKMQQTHHLQTK